MILVIVKAVILFLATVLHFILGFLVYKKNPRGKININLSLLAFLSAILTFAYGYVNAYYFYNYNHMTNQIPYHYLFFARLTYIGMLATVPGIMLPLYLKSAKNIRIKGIILYTVGGTISLLAIGTSAVIKNIFFKNAFFEAVQGPMAMISRSYFVITLLLGSYVSYGFYRESSGLQKIQAKYLLTGGLIFALSSTVVAGILPILGLRRYTEFSAVSSVFFVGFSAYAIIRYRFLDIETVIHKTLLWLATSGLIVIPLAAALFIAYTWLAYFSYTAFCLLIMGLFFAFLYLYRFIQPRINHLFRRKQYDYQQILLEVGEKLTREIDIRKATATLLNEVTRLMYLRGGVIFVRNEEAGEYQWYASIGQRAPAGLPETAGRAQSLEEEMKQERIRARYPRVIEFLEKKPEILEQQQIGFNPEYQEIKEEGEKLFAALKVELLIPLTIEGKILGLLGLGKKETLKAFNPQDLEVLQKVGGEAGIALYNALHHEAIVEKERLAEEMRLGREIQRNLLPQAIPDVTGLKVAGLMVPAKEIGGDYYDYIVTSGKVVGGQQEETASDKVVENSEAVVSGKVVKEKQENDTTVPLYHSTTDHLAIVIGDVSGKGVGAGLIMATAKATLKGLSEQGLTPKQTLCKANSILHEYTNSQKFMTMLYLEWDALNKKMRYSSAGHEHIIIYRSKAGSQIVDSRLELVEKTKNEQVPATNYQLQTTNSPCIEVIPSGGIVLGILPEIEEYLEDKELQLNAGDKIVLYTDGVTEARNEKTEMYELPRLVESVKRHGYKPAEELLAAIKNEVYAFIGNQPQYDDITLVVMEAARE